MSGFEMSNREMMMKLRKEMWPFFLGAILLNLGILVGVLYLIKWVFFK